MSGVRSVTLGRNKSQTFGEFIPGILPKDRMDRSHLFRVWHAGLANRDSAPVDIVAIGDSITTGAGASAAGKRWLDKMRDQLRALYQPAGVAGGEGFTQLNSTYNSPWTLTNTAVPTTPAGLGQGALNFGSTATATRSFTGTAIDVFYTKQSGGGTFSVSIDGGAATQINTSNTTEVNGVAQRFGGLTAGSHTLTIAGVSGTSEVEGVMVYNGDESKGIRVWDGGRSGIPLNGYVGSNQKYAGALSTIQPALIIALLGTNDWRVGSGVNVHTQNWVSLVSIVRAACTLPPSFLMVQPYVTNTTPVTTPFLGYYYALYQAAAMIGDVDVLDLYWKFGPNIQSNQMGLLYTDGIHPSDKGHQFIADAMVGRLRP